MAAVKRAIFTILSAVSLVLCLAAAGAWIGSRDWVDYFNTDAHVGCGLSGGYWRGVYVVWQPCEFDILGDPSWSILGFAYVPGLEVAWLVVIPHWFVCALTGILPAIWLRRYRRARRLRSDGMPHCAQCDYNLTGNVSGICPECGTPIPADVVRRPPDMKRRLFDILAAGSLAMCLMMTGISIWFAWLVMHGAPLQVRWWEWPGGGVYVDADCTLSLTWGDDDPGWWRPDQRYEFFGFRYRHFTYGPQRSTAVNVPLWFVCAVTAVLPGVWLWRWRRDRQGEQHERIPHCPKCGYNLTGNVSGICPECGTPLTAFLIWRVTRELTAPREPRRCSRCHYSLTDTLSGICPECGDAGARRSGEEAGGMKRRIFTILSAVSLVLAIGVGVLWVLSYVLEGRSYLGFSTGIPTGWHPPVRRFYSVHGVIGYYDQTVASPSAPRSRWEFAHLGIRVYLLTTSDLRIGLAGPSPPMVRIRDGHLPYAYPFLLAAVAPGIWLWRYRRDRRLRSDGMPHCAKCGYNLTGNVSGICPECGTPVQCQAKQEEIDRG